MMNLSQWGRFVVTATILFAFVLLGYFVGSGRHNGSSQLDKSAFNLFEANAFASSPGAARMMDGASRGEAISLATGLIEQDTEALFGLDHLTGNLFCWILNSRTGAIGSTFSINVRMALGNDQGDSDYVITTGIMEFRGGRAGASRPAESVVYVGEGNSGRIAAYTLLYDRQAIANGNVNAGELKLLGSSGMRNPNSQRDQ